MIILIISAVTSISLFLIVLYRKINQLKASKNKLENDLRKEQEKSRHLAKELDRYLENEQTISLVTDDLKEIYYNFELFNQSYPIIQKLSKTITDETERIAIQLSNDLQTLTKDSISAGNEINTSLSEIYDKKKQTLNIDLDKLIRIVNGIQAVTIDFSSMTTRLEEHMRKIEETVNNVFTSMSSISELSEQTHVLSINASVVAARIGTNGTGFNVIASEVQKLAGRSKKIVQDSSSMLNILKSELHSVYNYFSNSINKMNGASETLRDSKSYLQDIVEEIGEQVAKVGFSVEKSKDLSNLIAKQLGKVTYSLQFQDITQQQINNMMNIINELRRRMAAGFQQKTYAASINFQEISEKAKKIAGTSFTVQNEWISIGGKEKDKLIAIKNKKDMISDDLEGDITIF